MVCDVCIVFAWPQTQTRGLVSSADQQAVISSSTCMLILPTTMIFEYVTVHSKPFQTTSGSVLRLNWFKPVQLNMQCSVDTTNPH